MVFLPVLTPRVSEDNEDSSTSASASRPGTAQCPDSSPRAKRLRAQRISASEYIYMHHGKAPLSARLASIHGRTVFSDVPGSRFTRVVERIVHPDDDDRVLPTATLVQGPTDGRLQSLAAPAPRRVLARRDLQQKARQLRKRISRSLATQFRHKSARVCEEIEELMEFRNVSVREFRDFLSRMDLKLHLLLDPGDEVEMLRVMDVPMHDAMICWPEDGEDEENVMADMIHGVRIDIAFFRDIYKLAFTAEQPDAGVWAHLPEAPDSAHTPRALGGERRPRAPTSRPPARSPRAKPRKSHNGPRKPNARQRQMKSLQKELDSLTMVLELMPDEPAAKKKFEEISIQLALLHSAEAQLEVKPKPAHSYKQAAPPSGAQAHDGDSGENARKHQPRHSARTFEVSEVITYFTA